MNIQRPVPKTKQQLITLLKQQLQSVEDQISNMQQSLENERQKRYQLKDELEEKEKKIQQLIQHQTKTLGDKVHQGLFNTLQAANQMRAHAQAQIRKLNQDNILLNQKITQKDTNYMQARMDSLITGKRIIGLQQKKVDTQRKQQALVQKKQSLIKDLEIMKKQFQRIQKQEKQLRTHIQNTKKLRMYLNKHLEGPKITHNIVKSKQTPQNDNFWNGQS